MSRKKVDLSVFAVLHLATGDCLLASGCDLCTPADADDRVATPHLHFDAAREIWAEQHAQLRERYLAWLEARHEPGLHGLPLFGEIAFEGKSFPALNPKWPRQVQQRHRLIEAALAALHARGIVLR